MNYAFPVPPIKEQRRIIEKVNSIFEQLDIIDNLQLQYAADLEVLKSKIIDAGIQGKLTEQLPEDGTAEDLLEQIAEEKKQLVKEKKIKSTKVLPEITEDEMPFEIRVIGNGLDGERCRNPFNMDIMHLRNLKDE